MKIEKFTLQDKKKKEQDKWDKFQKLSQKEKEKLLFKLLDKFGMLDDEQVEDRTKDST
jgi:hypothetical protein